MRSNIIIVILLVTIIAVGSFFAGMKYQQSRRPLGRFANFQGQFGQRQGIRPVNGEIISVDETSITVKLSDNTSKIILLTDKTSINKSLEASKEDLKVGEKVAAFGTENSDGSITAQNIQINPVFRGTLQDSPTPD